MHPLKLISKRYDVLVIWIIPSSFIEKKKLTNKQTNKQTDEQMERYT